MYSNYYGLAHVSLYVTNAEKSEDFYCNILGFKKVHQQYLHIKKEDGFGDIEDDIYISFLDFNNLRIEIVEMPQHLSTNSGPFDHITIRVRNIEECVRELKEKKVCFETDNILTGPFFPTQYAKFIIFKGPDNEKIELVEIMDSEKREQ